MFHILVRIIIVKLRVVDSGLTVVVVRSAMGEYIPPPDKKPLTSLGELMHGNMIDQSPNYCFATFFGHP